MKLLLLAAAGLLHAADEAPAWLKQVAAAAHPSYSAKVPAVVLLVESNTSVDAAGRITTRSGKAIKILSKEGAREARADELYLTKTGKVREMQGWMIRPSGDVKRYGKDKVADVALRDEDVYNEVRKPVIAAAADAEPGAVFGYEAESEDRSVFTQFQWQFQDDLPTLVSRQILTLARSVTINHAEVKPKLGGGAYTWELTGLPHIEREPAMPAVSALAPRVAITLLPPAGSNSRLLASWADVSKWMSELHDPQATANDAVAGKARALTANATTEFDKIRALAEFAQGINYVSIQTGIGRGGGYQPHPASEVFAKSYGDCKDKANLMRAMLKVIGIESYPVSIYSGDRSYVRKEWPSPQQFNHAIIAVRVSDATQSAAIVTQPELGRLLIFDATDPFTMLGDLPEDEQGSFALISAGDKGALVQMPVLSAEANMRRRDTQIELAANGAVKVAVTESSRGQAARITAPFTAASIPPTTASCRIAGSPRAHPAQRSKKWPRRTSPPSFKPPWISVRIPTSAPCAIVC